MTVFQRLRRFVASLGLRAAAPAARELVTVQQAMAIARVSRRTIYNWIEGGRIEWIRTAGGARRIYADSLFREHEHGRPAV